MAPAGMIAVDGLVYEYPTARALDGVSLQIAPRAVTALVGPNGAGKTTLLRCLAALETPYAGTVLVDGLDTREKPREIHERLGYLPDFFGLYDELTVWRCLVYAARSHNIDADAAVVVARKAATRVGLLERLESRAGELSRGLRQRLAIGQAIVHEPKVLLLDEPAAGLDPQARRDLSRLLLELRDDGMTLVISSHILAELQDYSSEMIILEDGRIVGGQAIQVKETERGRWVVELAVPRTDLAAFLAAQGGVEVVGASDAQALVALDRSATERARLVRGLVSAGFELASFGESNESLEELYFAQVRRPRS